MCESMYEGIIIGADVSVGVDVEVAWHNVGGGKRKWIAGQGPICIYASVQVRVQMRMQVQSVQVRVQMRALAGLIGKKRTWNLFGIGTHA